MRLDAGKHYGLNAIDMIFKSDQYMQRRAMDSASVGDQRELLVPLTSDKGMCGSINSGIYRSVRDYVATKNRANLQVFSLGAKGASSMQRPMADILKVNISEISTPYNYPTVMALSEHLIQAGESFDVIKVFYNEYFSAIKTIVR